MALFQKSVLNQYIKTLDKSKVADAYTKFKAHFHNATKQEEIRSFKEEQYQRGFIVDLFESVFQYSFPTEIITELKNETDSKKADGAILKTMGRDPLYKTESPLGNKEVIAVIELKGTNTTDLNKVTQQAFGYKNNQKHCKYVIISNFEKLRFYIENAIDFEEFNLFTLSENEFTLLYVCLHKDYLLNDIPLQLKQTSTVKEENITKQLYKDYSDFKRKLFENIIHLNPQFDKLILFKKSQKLLDRILFILFAEDRNLIPANTIHTILNEWQQLQKLNVKVPLYDRFKNHFNYLNDGFKNDQYEVFGYNGGLFAKDDILDAILIDDNLLQNYTPTLSKYDYETEVDVNILGHIFEHSLNDIDEIQAELKQTSEHNTSEHNTSEHNTSEHNTSEHNTSEHNTSEHNTSEHNTSEHNTSEHAHLSKKISKRKKDGVFYTPKYITKYIVENTIGALCIEKRNEYGIIEDNYTPDKRKAKKKELLEKLNQYQDWLLHITILDPACGSGAFLNQALDFLIQEHRNIDELRATLLGESLVLPDHEVAILENNIFGVDLNEESVEIARLSLWLRTARKGRKLNSLNNNIKCGNSLIDDVTIAGDKAFNWYKEFPNVFTPIEKETFHITCVMHNTRTSGRMISYNVENGQAEYLSIDEEEKLTEIIISILKEDNLNILAFNICADHIHFLIVCEEEKLSKIIQKIKSKSAREFNIWRGITIPKTSEHAHLQNENDDTYLQKNNATTNEQTSEHAHLQNENDDAYLQKDNVTTNEQTSEYAHLQSGNDDAHLQNENDDIGLQKNKATTEEQTMEHAPLSNDNTSLQQQRGITQNYLWAQKYNCVKIESDKQLWNTIEYINNNRNKHELPPLSKGTCSLVQSALCTEEYAYRTEYAGGFDVVIGNPPYGETIKEGKEYFIEKYKSNEGKHEIYKYFIEKSISIIKKEGYMSFIVPDTWLTLGYFNKLRKLILNNLEIIEITETLYNVFEDAVIDTSIFTFKNRKIENRHVNVKSNKLCESYQVPINKDSIFYLKEENIAIQKIENCSNKLESICEIWQGLIAYHSKEQPREFGSNEKLNNTYRKLLFGGDIGKYTIEWSGEYLSYGKWLHRPRPSYIFDKEKILVQRIRNPKLKIRLVCTIDNEGYINGTGLSNILIIDTNFNLNYIISILNSKTTNYWFANYYKDVNIKPEQLREIPIKKISLSEQQPFIEKAEIMLQKNKELQTIKSNFIKLLQSRYTPNISEQKTSEHKTMEQKTMEHAPLYKKTTLVLNINTKLSNWNELSFKDFCKELEKQKIKLTISEQAELMQYFEAEQSKANTIQQTITQTDKEIDAMVYQLYELTDEEISIIENN